VLGSVATNKDEASRNWAARLGRPVAASLGRKLIAAIGLAVLLGIGGMILFQTSQQQADLLAENERTLLQVTESITRGLETIMLRGYADVAPYYAERLRDVRDVEDLRILRPDGRQAFLDNITVDGIHHRLGTQAFPRKVKPEHVQVLPEGDSMLAAAVKTRRPVRYYDTDSAGLRHLTILAPVVLDDRCHACHDPALTVNGVIKLTTSLAAVDADIAATWQSALWILIASVSVMVLAVWLVVRRWIVAPVVAASQAMASVAEGRLDQEVPVRGGDELAQMAISFNSMTQQLVRTYDGLQTEQNKLTTIILAAIEGIVVTDDADNVVLANPAAETLLGKPIWRLMTEGFHNLIDDPARIAGWLAQGGAVEDVAFNDRLLAVQITRITAPSGDILGSFALLRDVTEERRLEQRLRSLSTTDALTGLWNRRYLDQTLAAEVERSRRYGFELSILLFDIDHFKKFNDTYGHDQGDRVLKAVAEAVGTAVRQVDVPCRYGGEEFVVILPATAIVGAMEIADRLRSRIAGLDVDGLSVTTTIGVADLKEVGATTPAELLEAADKALYDGKRGGRNRVVRALPEFVPEAEE
jgi:diguanylate cyclase (GGDEF)-like protein